VISLRKLASLPDKSRARKLISLLAEETDPVHQAGLVEFACSFLGEKCSVPIASISDRNRALLRYRLAAKLGIEIADWDLQAPPDRSEESTRFPFSVWLDDLRSPFNVGSIVRTAEAYGFESVFFSPLTPGLEHPRTLRTAMGAQAYLAHEALSLQDLVARHQARPVFALELGGTPLHEFTFPPEGIVLVGGEELGLSPEALAWTNGSYGRVSLPLYGRKAALNVGVAFGILAAAWTAQARSSEG
jgi:TrmH family RNA methyltransferase